MRPVHNNSGIDVDSLLCLFCFWSRFNKTFSTALTVAVPIFDFNIFSFLIWQISGLPLLLFFFAPWLSFLNHFRCGYFWIAWILSALSLTFGKAFHGFLSVSVGAPTMTWKKWFFGHWDFCIKRICRSGSIFGKALACTAVKILIRIINKRDLHVNENISAILHLSKQKNQV